LKGNFWLFGGYGFDSTGAQGGLNDLWEFNPTSNQWTWVSGSQKANALGVYGTMGNPSAGNLPGARYSSVSWTDLSGNLWLFGGTGYDSTGAQGYLNDLWEFNPTGQQWTWMSGSQNANALGVYGTMGAPAAGNVPGARSYSVSWRDSGNNLWLFGGYDGGSGDSTGAQGYFNDLWEFNPTSKQWTWVNGSNTEDAVSIYGTLNVTSASNVPGARLGSVSWIDTGHTNLWLFGGVGVGPAAGTTGYLNDLWWYQP
jgi:N-acetylneuraminic acid mutarotase